VKRRWKNANPKLRFGNVRSLKVRRGYGEQTETELSDSVKKVDAISRRLKIKGIFR
jgi:hypothetical protein